MQQAKNQSEIISAVSGQLVKLFAKDIVFYPAENALAGEPRIFSAADGSLDESCVSDNEKAVAEWVLKNNKHAGATTETLSNAKCLYLAVRVNSNVYGVVGIVMNGQPFDAFEKSILLSILGECALAMENEKNAREKEEAAVLSKKRTASGKFAPCYFPRFAHTADLHIRQRKQSDLQRGLL